MSRYRDALMDYATANGIAYEQYLVENLTCLRTFSDLELLAMIEQTPEDG